MTVLQPITSADLVAEARAKIQVDAHPAVANVSDPALTHKERPIVVVCRTGGRAALSSVNLQRLGFSNVRSLAGGVIAWGETGLPLVVR